ncbi:MAG: hypothetical protein ACRCXM_11520 [Beijerinckiaceae bacterium]
MKRISLTRQITAVEAARKTIGGGHPLRRAERDLVVADLVAAWNTLRWLQENEKAIRDAAARSGAVPR